MSEFVARHSLIDACCAVHLWMMSIRPAVFIHFMLTSTSRMLSIRIDHAKLSSFKPSSNPFPPVAVINASSTEEDSPLTNS
mmetsp:Transcript_7862/g.21237  ORF Transcript_7862/g.21237 Transcript_7862/m.21237 type:complete len:81 (+) Transcript_7862:130-372(+)